MRETDMKVMIWDGITVNTKTLGFFFERMLCDLVKSCKVKIKGVTMHSPYFPSIHKNDLL